MESMPDLSPRLLTPLHTDNLPAGLLSAAGHESAGGVKEENAAKLPYSPARSPSLMATQEPVPPTPQQAQQAPPAQQLVLDSAQLAQFQLFQEFLQWHQRQQQEGGSSEQQVDQACSERPWQWRSAGQYTWPPTQQPQPPSQQPHVEPHKPAPQSAGTYPIAPCCITSAIDMPYSDRSPRVRVHVNQIRHMFWDLHICVIVSTSCCTTCVRALAAPG